MATTSMTKQDLIDLLCELEYCNGPFMSARGGVYVECPCCGYKAGTGHGEACELALAIGKHKKSD